MKLWVDDIRNAPDDSWTVVRTVTSAVLALYNFSSEITEISLDHDISHYSTLDESDIDQVVYACTETFLPVAICIGLMRKNAVDMIIGSEGLGDVPITIHSSNPVGADRMAGILIGYGFTVLVQPFRR